MTNILAPVSVGELIDKMTILQIKKNELVDSDKLDMVNYEYEQLLKIAMKNHVLSGQVIIDEEMKDLKEVNFLIWKNEDAARLYGNGKKPFDDNFIMIAASTYELNARRAQIKRAINKKFNSNIEEAKSYT